MADPLPDPTRPTLEAARARIEADIRAAKTRIAYKKDQLVQQQKELDALRYERQTSNNELNAEGRLNLVKSILRRNAYLESEVQEVEKITLASSLAKKACHVVVFTSSTRSHYFVVSPNVTCATLVLQVIANLVPDDPRLEPWIKYIKMRRRGMKDSDIIKEMRRETEIPSDLFRLPEYTLVVNLGRKPGLWSEVDLLSPDIRDQNAIRYLSSVGVDVSCGFGANGMPMQPLAVNGPPMLAPLYCVKRVTGNDEQSSLQASAFRIESIHGLASMRKPDSNVENASSTISIKTPLEQPTLPVTAEEIVPKALPQKKTITGAYYSLGPCDQSLNEVEESDRPAKTMDKPERSQSESAIATKSSFQNFIRSSLHFSKSKLPAISTLNVKRRLSHLTISRYGISPDTESSAFEAFATLILFGEPGDPLFSSAESSKRRKEQILSKAADLMDFAWLGRQSASARLYCRQLGHALGLPQPPRQLWSEVFKDIVHGWGDRIAHSVDFDEFHMQYKELRRRHFPGSPDVTYGDMIDELVQRFKAEMKDTYKLENLAVPPSVWARRAKSAFLIVAFILLVLATIDGATAFAEIATTFPQAFKAQHNFTEYYSWSQMLCARILRSDISNLVVRQARVDSVAHGKCSPLFYYPGYKRGERNTTALISGWSSFQQQIPNAVSAWGSFAEYDASGYENEASSGDIVSAGLDVSTRAVVTDFTITNSALMVTSHAQYVTEFDASGMSSAWLAMTHRYSTAKSVSSGLSTFSTYTLISSVLLLVSLLLTVVPLLKKTFGSTNDDMFYVLGAFLAIAFGTCVPLVVKEYDPGILAAAILCTAFCLSLALYSLEQSWSAILGVFDQSRMRIFSLVVQFIILVVGYAVALEGWYNDRAYTSYNFGQTALIASVAGIVPNYVIMLFPNEQNSFGDFLSVIFGMVFVLMASCIVYTFFAVVIASFRNKGSVSDWGLLTCNRKIYRPAV